MDPLLQRVLFFVDRIKGLDFCFQVMYNDGRNMIIFNSRHHMVSSGISAPIIVICGMENIVFMHLCILHTQVVS